MAEHEPGTPETLAGSFGGQSFVLAARDLLSILLLLGTFGMAYVVWNQLSFGLRLLHEQHQDMTDACEKHTELVQEQTRQIEHWFLGLDANLAKPLEKRVPMRRTLSKPPAPERRIPPEGPR